MEKTKISVEWQKVHIFISSTFNDMHAERDYLVKKVFPKLQDWCEKRKIRMVDIDLRWGVSETDTMNKKVVSTCLRNIDKCRPFFICLLGQRRGWVPKRDDISDDTFKDFPEIKNYADNASVTEMEILHALIDPLHKTRSCLQEESGEYYDPVKHAFFYLRDPSYLDFLPSTPDLLRKAYTNELDELIEDISRQTADNELKTWREKKIPATNRPVRNYNVKWNSEAQTPELRTPLTSSSDEPKSKVSAKWRRLWKLAGIDLEDRDISIPEGLREKAEKFNTTFTKGRLGEFKAENKELSDIIFSDLTEAIRERFYDHIDIVEAESVDETDLQKEIDQQEQFVALNSVGFIQRTGDFDQLDAYAADNSQKLFVLTAPAGMGKSMFLAKWVDRYRTKVNSESNESIHFRFIGQSDKSTAFYNIWYSLLEEIKEHTGKLEDEIIKDEQGNEDRLEAIPTDPVELHNSLYDILRKIGTRGKTIIVLDALNQLETGLKDLNWLQSELPEGINMIVSFKRGTEDTDAEKLYGILKDSAVISEIKPFESTDDRKKLIDEYLMQYLKELDQKHINALLEIEASKNPLFLKIVLNELRIFGAFLNIKDKIRNDFGNDPLSAFEGVLKRLENDPAYSSIPPKISVPLIFGLLANSRYGLSADELVHMLLDTLGYERKDENLNQIKETVYLNLRQIRPYLSRKEGRYDFFYESFKIAALKRYANEKSNYQISGLMQGKVQSDINAEIVTLKIKDWHKILADYFYKLPLWVKKNSNNGGQNQEQESSREADYNDDPNKRKVSELPYHLTMAEDWGSVEETLCNLWFVEAKVRAGMVFELQQDYADALRRFPEMQEKKRKEEEQQNKIKKYTDELIAYSKAWSERRRQLALGKAIIEVEPQHPEPPPSCRMWTQDEIDLECQRIIENPTPLDTLSIFNGFVISQCHTLIENGSGRWRGFVLQHALNYSPAGAVHDAAALILPTLQRPYFSRRWSIDERTNPIPALLRTLKQEWGAMCVRVTPDGRYAVSGSDHGMLNVWSLESGQSLRILKGHTGSISSVSLTPDGKRAVSGSWDKSLRVWDLQDGLCLFTLEGHTDYFTSVSLTPDGRRAVSVSKDKTLRVWDLESGKCLKCLWKSGNNQYLSPFLRVAVTPDGRRAVSCDIDMRVLVWNLESGLCQRFLEGALLANLAPDGRRAVLADRDGTLYVGDLESGQRLRILAWPPDFDIFKDGYMMSDGRFAVSANVGKPLQVWDPETGQSLRTLEAYSSRVTEVSLTLDCRCAVSGSWDGTLRVWNIENGQGQQHVERHMGDVNCVSVTPDGRRAVSASDDGTLRVWDTVSSQCLRILSGHANRVNCVSVTPDGKHAVSGSWDMTLRVWDLESGQCLRILEGHTDVVNCVSVTSDGLHAVSTTGRGLDPTNLDNTLRVWNLESGQCLRTLNAEKPGGIHSLSVIPGSMRVVLGIGDGSLMLWDLESGECRRTSEAHKGMMSSVSVTQDGWYVVSGGWDKTMRVWSTESGIRLQTLKGNTGKISSVSVTPDGTRAVSGSWDSTIWTWDLDLKNMFPELLSYFLAPAPILSVAISPSGSLVVCGTSAGEVLFMELRGIKFGTNIEPQPILSQDEGLRGALAANIEKSIKTRIHEEDRKVENGQEKSQSSILCPHCGGSAHKNSMTGAWLGFLSMLIVSILLPLHSLWWLFLSIPMGFLAIFVCIPHLFTPYHCKSCGSVSKMK
ncbi:MAG: hypothetical protein A2Y79_12215 [Deltaproteobacteria bacterium RBG_13_43_22]|nr:MAG: hypothetical protein A2Y79_12215 [Deltaproteobacteria bacterium RBG_13_43_22]